MNITHLVEKLVKGLVGDKDSVTVTEKQLSKSVNIFVQVGEFDQGKVLGQRRTTLDALIAIVEEAGRRDGKLIRIELLEPIKTTKPPLPHQFTAENLWKSDEFWGILKETAEIVFQEYDWKQTDIQPTVTVFEILVSKKSPAAGKINVLQRPFETLFHAIGKSFKHVVHVDLIAVR